MPASPFTLQLASLTVALAVVLTACGDGGTTGPGGPPPDLPVASIRIDGAPATMLVGQSVRIAAMPLAANGTELPGRAVAWSSVDPARATVGLDGTVTAVGEGVATIRVASEGVLEQLQLTIEAVPAVSIELDVAALTLLEGGARALVATLRDAQGQVLDDRTVTWTSESPSVASVSAAGVVTAGSEGTARIVARHGALAADALVTVNPDVRAALLYGTDAGGLVGARLHRSPLTLEQPVEIFGVGGASQATASPDGTRLAFTCVISSIEGTGICIADIDGSDVRVLTGGDTANEDQPAWSPDGTRIAYRRWEDGATPGRFNPTDIWVTDVQGNATTRVTDDALVQHHPAWSPAPVDGQFRLVFVEERVIGDHTHSHLVTAGLDGSGRVALTTPGSHADDEPSWSPDGRTIAFTRQGGEVSDDLWLVDVSTGQQRPVFAAPLADRQRHPAWSPDGRLLAFTSVHEPSPSGNYRAQVYTVRADGSGLRRRTTTDVDKADVAWVRVAP